MLKDIREDKYDGILSWHRLARNSVDGGLIIYSIDTTKIASLRFPTFWFEPTPQGLFMLQVAFGQSKYYSDNLSENVKRGIRQKLASSNDFDEIKSFAEKIGTNRRLLSKQVFVGLRPPFDLIAKQKAFCEARPAPASPCGINSGGGSEQSSRSEKSLSFDWSGMPDLNGLPSRRHVGTLY